ncbi:MAG: response regulator [Proteobacteria bacterium]|nr:response regulator [Pseudomonadota bacterium]MBU1639126.1 response regulator [Pseudomonadota bacterium]
MKICIAEDNEDSRVLLEDVLKASGYEVESAENGRQALELIQKSPPDLIVSDILMPEMDGYALCRAIKADQRLAAIPFIFYTATYTDPKDEDFAMSLGASRFLIKPMEMPEFLAEITALLAEYQAGKLATPLAPHKNAHELEQSYSEVLARKLTKKITQLEAEQTKLRASEEKYRRLVESLQDSYFFYTHDPKGVFTYLSPSIHSVLGYSQEEFSTHYTKLRTDKSINDEASRHTELSMQGIKQPPYELEVRHKDGRARRLEVTEEPIVDKHGTVVAVEGIAHDITARYESARALAAARDEWENTFQAISDPIMILDPELRILRTNQATCALFGKEPQNLAGRYCYELFQGGDQPCPGCPVTSTLQDHFPHFAEVEHGALKKTFLVSASPRLDSQGHIASIVHSAKDITRQKALETQVRQTQKMEAIGTLAGGIAHDFNNILTAIIGYGQLLAMELPPAGQPQEHLEQILQAGNRAKDLVAQILTFSRQSEQEKKPVQVQYVVKEALKLLRSSVPTTIAFKEQIDSECGAVLADPSQIHQIIMNLCTNAYHAMHDKGGILAVSLKEIDITPHDYITQLALAPGPYLRLEVSDTGCGMEKDICERIFDPYFTTKKKGDGTGLGLAVVHGIVKNMHGHITVYSEPGKGTTFHVYLPRVARVMKEQMHEAARPEPRGKERILLVDDEKMISEMEKQMLEHLGYQVTALTSPVDALSFFQNNPSHFDLVITDMTMPFMTGTELAQELLTMRRDIPIVLCTGFSDIINEEKAEALGIKRYIMKPLIMSEFSRVVRQVLDES